MKRPEHPEYQCTGIPSIETWEHAATLSQNWAYESRAWAERRQTWTRYALLIATLLVIIVLLAIILLVIR